MPPEPEVSECPECGAGVKLGLDGSRYLAGTELTESDVRDGEYFLCPVCQVAWDVDERTPYDVPVMSAGPGGALSEATAGRSISNGETSNYRLLGYGEEGELILRDVGELAFARDDSPGPTDPRKLERQLGEVIAVEASGYPAPVQGVLNRLRPAYCVHGTVGEADGDGLAFDADEGCEIVEAVPVSYATATEYAPEFADAVWNEDFDPSQADGGIPHARRTMYVDGGPAADVYVFPSDLRNDRGVPLLAGIQRGMTHHIEKFTTNFTGAFDGGIVDVIFVSPADRPYFAAYCLGDDRLELAHELRAELELPVVHRGWDADRTRVYDVRYNPLYVERVTENGTDRLVPSDDRDGAIDIGSGAVSGPFEERPEPHELVVTIPEEGKSVEVARLGAPDGAGGGPG